MIIPVRYNVRVYGGDSFELVLNWKDENGDTFALSGKSATMQFFVSDENRTSVKVLSTTPTAGGSVITLADTNPNITVLIVAGETGIGSSPDFTAEPGFFILHIINSATLVDRLMEGRAKYRE